MISFIVPYRPSDPWRQQSFEYVHRYLNQEWAGAEVIIADASPELPFDRSRSRNLGAERATGDILVFVDADTFCPPIQVRLAVKQIDEGAGWVFPYDRYCSLTETSTQQYIFGRQTEHEFEHVFPSPKDPEPAVGGCVVVQRRAFDMVSGYDERFVGWGEEDRAFAMSLATLVHNEVRIPGPIYHFWHPHPVEDCFGQPYFEHNRTLGDMYRNAAGHATNMLMLCSGHSVTGNEEPPVVE